MKPFPAPLLKLFFKSSFLVVGLSVLVGVLVLNMTIKGGTSQACAVCKFQRRRCSKGCPLAPHFPADQQKTFQDAHRLFGVSKIQKILKQVHPAQHEEAIKSIKYESEMRARFPVHGCLGVIWQLQFQMQQVQEELRHVRAWIDVYENQHHHHHSGPHDLPLYHHHQHAIGLPMNDSMEWQLPDNVDDVPSYHHHQNTIGLPLNDFLFNGGAFVQTNNNEMMMTKAYVNNCRHSDAMAAQGYPIQHEMDVPYGCDDYPFDTIEDDRESYNIDSKDATKSSAESSLRDIAQSSERVMESELKNAAAYFSLTNVR